MSRATGGTTGGAAGGMAQQAAQQRTATQRAARGGEGGAPGTAVDSCTYGMGVDAVVGYLLRKDRLHILRGLGSASVCSKNTLMYRC